MLKHIPKLPSMMTAAFAEWRKDNPSLLAAAIAYYSFFAIIPLMVIVAAIGSFFFGHAAANGLLHDTLIRIFGMNVASLIEKMLATTYTQESGIVVGAAAIIILFGASFVFVQLRKAINIIWGVEEKKKYWVEFIEGRLMSLAMLTSIAALMIFWIAASTSLSTMALFSGSFSTAGGILFEAGNFLVLLITSYALFAIFFRFLPAVKLTWEDVTLGAAVTAVMFTMGSHIVAFYLSKIGLGTLYGVAGSMVVLLVWLYISAQVFLFGVIFTKVFAARHGSRKPRKRSAGQRRRRP
jgi:membrane protein